MRQSVSDVEKLVAINEIREVMARYARHADHKEFEDLAGLFTPDGTFTPHNVDDSVWMQMKGREGITKTISENVGNAQVLHQLFSYEIHQITFIAPNPGACRDCSNQHAQAVQQVDFIATELRHHASLSFGNHRPSRWPRCW